MAGTQGGFGLEVKVDISSTLTVITYVLEGSEYPKFKKFIADATPHSATQGYTRRVSTGKRSLEPFKLVLGWDKDEATHAALHTVFDGDSPVNMSIASPDGEDEVISFSAHVEEIGRAAEQEGLYTAEVMISPDGHPTIS